LLQVQSDHDGNWRLSRPEPREPISMMITTAQC
jgi:hypothetical protein